MKRINNISAPTIITVKHDATSALLSIVQVGGRPLTQSQDTQEGIWSPDRSIEPLFLEPHLEVVNSATGQAIRTSVTYDWYIDKVAEWDDFSLTGKIPSSFTKDEGFYLEKDSVGLTGRLIVEKNINYIETWDGEAARQFGDSRGPVALYCVASYSVPGSSVLYTESTGVSLTTQNLPEESYIVTIDTPSNILYHPLARKEVSEGVFQKDNIKTINAHIARGKTIISSEEEANFKYFWYYKNGQGEEVLISNNDLFYVSGQHTNTLVVNADYAEEICIYVKIADSTEALEPNIPTVASVTVSWFIPNIEATPYSTSGSAVKDVGGIKEFNSILQMKGGEINAEAASEFIRLEWETKDYKSTTSTSRGWGNKVNIAKSVFYPNDTEVKINAYVLGPLEQITCNGEAVTIEQEGVQERVESRN